MLERRMRVIGRGLLGVLGVAFGVVFGVAVGCKGASADAKILSDIDFAQPDDAGAPFERGKLIEPGAFVDVDGLTFEKSQKFLHATPYDSSSFLETYQSNGVRASDAILRAANIYHINPIVFLVYAQAMGGLVSAITYTFPPERVEYVFRCGCFHDGACAPEFAGFDRQVDCLGRALRAALHDIAASPDGKTVGGWGPGKASYTLDGYKVTPADDATAVIYDRTPMIAPGEAGGTWLIWNIWNLYAKALQYSGPSTGVTGTGWIGDPCASAASCGFEDATCGTNYPKGMCTVACTGTCPTQANKAESVCVTLSKGASYCFPTCNPLAPACRADYTCARVPGDNAKGFCKAAK
jgi:hypothetical protein